MELIQRHTTSTLLYASLKASFVSVIASAPFFPVLTFSVLHLQDLQIPPFFPEKELFLPFGWMAALVFATIAALCIFSPVVFLHGLLSSSTMKGSRIALLFTPLFFINLILSTLITGELGYSTLSISLILSLWSFSLTGALIYIATFNRALETRPGPFQTFQPSTQ